MNKVQNSPCLPSTIPQKCDGSGKVPCLDEKSGTPCIKTFKKLISINLNSKGVNLIRNCVDDVEVYIATQVKKLK